MTHSVLISLPVHERPDIVRRQIANILKFAPNALICLHLSASAQGPAEAFQALAHIEGVLINATSFPTSYKKGLLHVHASNFLYALSQGSLFHKILLLSSNELLIRGGLEDYIGGYTFGAQIEKHDPSADWHLFNKKIEQDPRMKGLMSALNLPLYFGGQAEGQFYECSLFREIIRLYGTYFSEDPCGFETEECVPQTIAIALTHEQEKVSLPITLQNYSHVFDITPQLITRIRSGRGFIFGSKREQCLRSPHIGSQDLSSIFSVKRIPREDCALRSYIENLSNA